jgi:hypothetical protein
MKSFQTVTTKTYTPIWIHQEFSVYDKQFINIRSRMKYKADTCIKCNHKFELNEMIGLGCFENIGNKMLCQKCAKELME